MENNTQTTEKSTSKNEAQAAPKKVKELPVNIQVTLQNNGNNSTISYIMDNPFPDEILGQLRLTPVNPNKSDDFGRAQQDKSGEKRKGLLDYFCRKSLALSGSLTLKGIVTLKKYANVEYVSIDIKNPCPDLIVQKNSDTFRMFIRKTETEVVFTMLCKKILEYIPDTDAL